MIDTLQEKRPKTSEASLPDRPGFEPPKNILQNLEFPSTHNGKSPQQKTSKNSAVSTSKQKLGLNETAEA